MDYQSLLSLIFYRGFPVTGGLGRAKQDVEFTPLLSFRKQGGTSALETLRTISYMMFYQLIVSIPERFYQKRDDDLELT